MSGTIGPHRSRCFSVTAALLPGAADPCEGRLSRMDAEWRLRPELENLAGLEEIRFQGRDGGWRRAVVRPGAADPELRRMHLPEGFEGRTRIPFRARFYCDPVPGEIGMVFEKEHLERLSVNGSAVELSSAAPHPAWDRSCVRAELGARVRSGWNEVAGLLAFEPFETAIEDDAFFGLAPPRPSCDVFVSGRFRVKDGRIQGLGAGGLPPFRLPVELSSAGWPCYHGAVELTARVELTEEEAQRLVGLELELFAEDAVEVWVDERLAGRRILAPYRLPVGGLSPGRHELRLCLTGTSRYLEGTHGPWGVRSAAWILGEKGT